MLHVLACSVRRRWPTLRVSALMLAACLMLGTASSSYGHAHWISPPPRDNSTGYKDPAGPCGPPPRTSPMVLTAGQSLTVKFQETVDHPGCFLIDFSPANDQNWQFLANIPHKTTPTPPRDYTAQITLPAGVSCPACTLRVRQIMLGSDALPCPPNPIDPNTTYYSCADVALNSTASADLGVAPSADLAVVHPPSETTPSSGCQAAPRGPYSPSGSAGVLLALLTLAASLSLRRLRRMC